MLNRLQPILKVADLEPEKLFYVRLGFTVTYESEGLVALAFGDGVLLGLQECGESDPAIFEKQMLWQFGVDSVREFARHCERAGLMIESQMEKQAWGEWTFALRSPNGFRVVLEGPK